MFFKLPLALSLAATLFVLPSCHTALTPAQRAGLSTVAVAKTSIGLGAYGTPYGGDVQMQRNASNVPATGILGPLVGMAIGSAVAGAQDSNFVGKNSGYFAAVQKNVPSNLEKTLNDKLTISVKNSSFFRSKVVANSTNVITSEITSYRLIRQGKNNQKELLFTAEVKANIYLRDSSGKNLVGANYTAIGGPTFTIRDYAEKPLKSRQAYDSAIEGTVKIFAAVLEINTK